MDEPYCVPFIVRQVKFLRKSGIHVDVFHFRGRKNPLNYARAKIALYRYCNGKSYDLVHAQWGQSAFLAIPRKLPLVITYRGTDLEGLPDKNGHDSQYGKLLSLGSRVVSRFANQIILVSDNLGRKLPTCTFHVIPSGIDLSLFKPMDRGKIRNQLGYQQNQSIVLFVGSSENPIKRYRLAKRAVELVKNDIPTVVLINPNNIPHQIMPNFFNASDVLLLTSIHEGSPNVVKEALACNLPVVSTDVGDVRERIENIEGCIVCEDGQPSTIAEALKQVLNRNSRIEGRNTVLNLDENLLTKKVIAVYNKALCHA